MEMVLAGIGVRDMGHAFTTRKHKGRDSHDIHDAMVYELLDNGAVVYTLTYPFDENGEEIPQAEKTFRMKAEMIIDRILVSSGSEGESAA